MEAYYFFRCVVLIYCILIIILDAGYLHGPGWRRGYTQWSFCLTLVYFASAVIGDFSWNPWLQALALATAGTVNTLFWLILKPMMFWNNKTKAESLTKHGATLVWLVLDSLLSLQMPPPLTWPLSLLLGSFPFLYILFTIEYHRRFDHWLYGDFFAAPLMRVGFVITPICIYLLLGAALQRCGQPHLTLVTVVLVATPLHFWMYRTEIRGALLQKGNFDIFW